ncbi:unnamed protein product, partial [Prorocentrum cordatum]
PPARVPYRPRRRAHGAHGPRRRSRRGAAAGAAGAEPRLRRADGHRGEARPVCSSDEGLQLRGLPAAHGPGDQRLPRALCGAGRCRRRRQVQVPRGARRQGGRRPVRRRFPGFFGVSGAGLGGQEGVRRGPAQGAGDEVRRRPHGGSAGASPQWERAAEHVPELERLGGNVSLYWRFM